MKTLQFLLAKIKPANPVSADLQSVPTPAIRSLLTSDSINKNFHSSN